MRKPEQHEWETWLKKLERLLGHSLGGDDAPDWSSVEWAHDAFVDGFTPEDYAASVAHHAKLAVERE